MISEENVRKWNSLCFLRKSNNFSINKIITKPALLFVCEALFNKFLLVFCQKIGRDSFHQQLIFEIFEIILIGPSVCTTTRFGLQMNRTKHDAVLLAQCQRDSNMKQEFAFKRTARQHARFTSVAIVGHICFTDIAKIYFARTRITFALNTAGKLKQHLNRAFSVIKTIASAFDMRHKHPTMRLMPGDLAIRDRTLRARSFAIQRFLNAFGMKIMTKCAFIERYNSIAVHPLLRFAQIKFWCALIFALFVLFAFL
mmetsp:Transcript_17970/g.28409  ORF Transcript_17970/g.28409 Transcript_17970/m.28409 type:complete len:255 (+) Transcript_17970:2007-2771(+)